MELGELQVGAFGGPGVGTLGIGSMPGLRAPI